MPFSSRERKEYTYIFVKRTGERTDRVREEKKYNKVLINVKKYKNTIIKY